MVRPWPRLPREAVAAPSLAVSKARLDGALSTLVWWKGSLLMAGGLNKTTFKGPLYPKPFCNSLLAFDNSYGLLWFDCLVSYADFGNFCLESHTKNSSLE